MATLGRECDRGRDGWRLRFYTANKRKSIWLSGITEQEANVWKLHVEQLVACSIPPIATSAWVAGLSEKHKEKLAAVGLIAIQPSDKPKVRPTDAPTQLKPFIDWYIKRRTVKPSTVETWDKARSSLTRYFGESRDIRTISSADAEAWRDWLAVHGNNREGKPRKVKGKKPPTAQVDKPRRTDLSDNTVRRRTGIAKQFFAYAIKAKLITENPFVGLPASVGGNEEKQYFVTREEFTAMIEACSGAEWEGIIALSRLGGLRCPSELKRLKWEDVDFAGHRIRIHASKTEHHKDGGVRDCPLFPDLRPFLERLAELANARGAKPTDYVITNRGSESIYRTRLEKVLKRAGLKQWPRLFQNMRASRETELLDEFPIKDVCAWIGNSQAVAMKHYAMRRKDSFMRAAGIVAGDVGSNGGPIGGPVARQSQATSGNQETEKVSTEPQKTEEKQEVLPLSATGGNQRQTKKSGRGGTRTPDIYFVRVAL